MLPSMETHISTSSHQLSLAVERLQPPSCSQSTSNPTKPRIPHLWPLTANSVHGNWQQRNPAGVAPKSENLHLQLTSAAAIRIQTPEFKKHVGYRSPLQLSCCSFARLLHIHSPVQCMQPHVPEMISATICSSSYSQTLIVFPSACETQELACA